MAVIETYHFIKKFDQTVAVNDLSIQVYCAPKIGHKNDIP